jgi:hypothetical protein
VPLPISTATRRHSEGEGGCGSRLLPLAVMPLSSAAQLLVAAVHGGEAASTYYDQQGTHRHWLHPLPMIMLLRGDVVAASPGPCHDGALSCSPKLAVNA